MTINELNILSKKEAIEAFSKCCVASNWVNKMQESRPFESMEVLLKTADKIWSECDTKDHLEAFSGHPKIGDVSSLAKKYANTKKWAGNEQKGVESATSEVIKRLTKGNEAYEQKFGFIFIVCATGKSAAEMLVLLEERLPNERETELKIAAAEQHKITKIRLKKIYK